MYIVERLSNDSLSAPLHPMLLQVQNQPAPSPTTTKEAPTPQPVATCQPQPQPPEVDWRPLGSFERLLARKAAQGPRRLSIPHACVAIVRGPPLEEAALRAALLPLVRRHPLLRARIKGDGRVESPPVAGVRMGAAEPNPLRWAPCALTDEEVVDRVLVVEDVVGVNDGGSGWYAAPFEAALDATDFDQAEGPLWQLRVLRRQSAWKKAESALLFAYNHAISDQASANTVVHELLAALSANLSANLSATASPPPPQPFPPSIEQAVVAGRDPGLNTLRYTIREGVLGALPCTTLPHPSRRAGYSQRSTASSSSWGLPAATRKTICELRRLEPPALAALAAACRRRGLTVTAALSAAMLYVTSDSAHAPEEKGQVQLYRLLLSLNMRAFSAARTQRGDADTGAAAGVVDWADGAVASAAGAMDYLARVPAGSGRRLLASSSSAAGASQEEEAARARFWEVARECRGSFDDFVARGYVPESVALFDWGMRAIELNEVVEREAENAQTLGRAYTCGVSNMGVFGGGGGEGLVPYGPYRLEGLHYATSSSLTGTLYQLSCGTVGGALCLTLHGASPLVDRVALSAFADALVRVLACVAEGNGV